MKRLIRHLLFWVVILCWSTVVFVTDDAWWWLMLQFNLIRLPVIIAATYATVYGLLPYLLEEKPRIPRFIAGFGVVLLVATLLDRWLIGWEPVDALLRPTGLCYTFFNTVPLIRNLFLLLSIIGLATCLRFFKVQRQNIARQTALEQERLATELSMLKAQINPHFLFNTLNNLYQEAVQHASSGLADALHDLAGIMRYLTYDSNAPQVALVREIELMQQFIGLQNFKQAHDDASVISFKMEGNPDGCVVAPALLLPLVENAFKHGIGPQNGGTVDIRLRAEPSALFFLVKNTLLFPEIAPSKHRGAGLDNLRRRLELLYPGRHSLQTERTERYFTATLTIAMPHG